jgi:hypothetical protein
MSKDKKCKLCKKSLNGKMLFYPKICLSCVIDYESKGELNKLKKYEKTHLFNL